MEASTLTALIATLSPHGAPMPGATPRAVTNQEIVALLSSARVAPSADNAQTWRFITVGSPAKLDQVARCVGEPLRDSVAHASMAIVVCGVPWMVTRARREQPFVLLDVPIAVTHILLRAAELGLEHAWTLDSDEDQLRSVLGIPSDVRVIAVVALGRSER